MIQIAKIIDVTPLFPTILSLVETISYKTGVYKYIIHNGIYFEANLYSDNADTFFVFH